MKILIIGDSCEDIFIYGKCDRICPEAPVPVFNPIKKIINSGMASNVYNNINALTNNKSTIKLITNPNTIKKTRYVEINSNQMIMRYDENDHVKRIDWNDIDNIIGNGWDIIIISDYNKGFLEIEDIKHICNIGKLFNILVFLDIKKKLIPQDKNSLKDVFCFKINEKEYHNSELFFDGYYYGNIIITKGSEGCEWKNTIMGNVITYGLEDKANVLDLSGAGDTFMAALVYKYVETKSFIEAIEFANKCASYVVTQKGVAVIGKTKIL